MKDRFHLWHFDPATDAADAAESGDVTDVAAADTTPAADSAPSYLTAADIQPLVDFQQSAMPVLQQLGQVLNAEEEELFGGDPAQGDVGGGDPDEFDPYDPNTIRALAQAEAKAMMEPFSGVLGLVAQEKGEQLARNALEEIKGDIGDFDPDATFLIAQSILNDPNARGVNPAQTLRGVAQWVQGRDAKIAEAAVEKYKAEMQALAGAPRGEVAGAGAAATEIDKIEMGSGGADKYSLAVQRAMARRNPSQVV